MGNEDFIEVASYRKGMSMFDSTDFKIIQLLQENARMNWREIGEIVHLTGQAVGKRINKLEEAGVIQKYTIDIDRAKLEGSIMTFVTLFLYAPHYHIQIQSFFEKTDVITEMYRISGDGCYIMILHTSSHQQLEETLADVLHYGDYRINTVIKTYEKKKE